MSRIRGEDRSVKSLLGQKFRIDYYQRDYKWERKQVRELIEDLTSRSASRIASMMPVSPSSFGRHTAFLRR